MVFGNVSNYKFIHTFMNKYYAVHYDTVRGKIVEEIFTDNIVDKETRQKVEDAIKDIDEDLPPIKTYYEYI